MPSFEIRILCSSIYDYLNNKKQSLQLKELERYNLELHPDYLGAGDAAQPLINFGRLQLAKSEAGYRISAGRVVNSCVVLFEVLISISILLNTFIAIISKTAHAFYSSFRGDLRSRLLFLHILICLKIVANIIIQLKTYVVLRA